MAQTLEELKAENAKAEESTEQNTETVETETKTEVVEEELEQTEEAEESTEEEAGEKETESWKSTEEQTSDGDAKFTGSDVAAAKRKLKAKVSDQKDEITSLREEVEALKSQGVRKEVSQPTQKSAMPKSGDFDYEADYEKAMEVWIDNRMDAKSATNTQVNSDRDAKTAEQQKTEKAVDDHYLRANDLVKNSDIDPDVFSAADLAVRQAVESVLPENGDAVTDGIISKLGKGSEKVMYYLGRNASKRAEFVEKLREDKSGLTAAIFLGNIQNDVGKPNKRVSNAPAPGTKLNGDVSGGESALKSKKAYEAAGDDVQARIDIKRAAKKKGVDVSNW